METNDFLDGEDGMSACAVADPDHDGPPPHPELSSEEDAPAIPSLAEAEEPAIGDGGEVCIPALISFPIPAQFLAELSGASSILALPTQEESLEELEARLIHAFAFESLFDQGKLGWAHAFGRLLIDYKRLVGHGNFELRLRENVLGPGRSRSTISDCMQIASVDLDELLGALVSQNAGNLSIRTALEYLRGRETDRPDARRRVHRDRRVAPPRGLSTTAPRHDGAEVRPVAHESVTREGAGQLIVDAPDAATSPLDDASVAFEEPEDRAEDDAADEPDDGSEHSSGSELVTNSSRAVAEPPTGPQRSGTPPPMLHVVGDEPVVTSVPALEIAATAGVENLTETAASAEAEGTLADESWLAGLAIRSTLAQTEAFDREALTWRRLNPQIQTLVDRAALSTDERTQISPRTWVARGYLSRLAYAAGVRHPGEWRACDRCHGQGKTPGDERDCGVCRGTGFEVTQIGDGPGSSTRSDGQDA